MNPVDFQVQNFLMAISHTETRYSVQFCYSYVRRGINSIASFNEQQVEHNPLLI